MKILALELSFSEDISSRPSKYGGVGRTLYLLAKNDPNVWVAGSAASLCNSDLKNKIILSESEINFIKNNDSLLNLENQFDLVLHCSPPRHLRLNKPALVWCPGQFETVHPENKNILLHNKETQYPQITNRETRIHEFVLGVELPEMNAEEKEDYIFQCTNHYFQMQSHVLAYLCNKYQIKCYFAGPITEGYDFINYIDNVNTRYLGMVIEEEKIKYLKKASYFAGLYAQHINELPLSFKQALSYGCPILTTNNAAFVKYLDLNNSSIIKDEETFVHAWEHRAKFNRDNCYHSAKKFSSEKMIESFRKIYNNIINN